MNVRASVGVVIDKYRVAMSFSQFHQANQIHFRLHKDWAFPIESCAFPLREDFDVAFALRRSAKQSPTGSVSIQAKPRPFWHETFASDFPSLSTQTAAEKTFRVTITGMHVFAVIRIVRTSTFSTRDAVTGAYKYGWIRNSNALLLVSRSRALVAPPTNTRILQISFETSCVRATV